MRVKFLAPLLAIAVASVLGYAALDGTDAPHPAVGSGVDRGARARGGYSTLIANLPEIGRLTWRCGLTGRSSTALTLPLPGFSVDVTVDSDGRQVFRNRRLDPPASNRRHGRLATPLEKVHRQRWRIRHYHPPGPVLAIVRIRFARNRGGECFVPRAVTDVRTTDTSAR